MRCSFSLEGDRKRKSWMVLAGFPTGRDLEMPAKSRHGSESE